MSKKAKHGLDAIEERRKLREAHTKSLAEQEKKQLADIQKRSQEIKSTIKKGDCYPKKICLWITVFKKPSSKKESTKE